MSEHDLEKLLGGFAADTLTAEEKQRLYAAALQDQPLFNALADEQALKELLTDPAVRGRLLRALNRTGASGAGGWLDWIRRPAGLAWAGGLAAAAFAVVLGTRMYQDSLKQAAPSVVSEGTGSAVPPPAAAPPFAQSEPQPTTGENAAPATDSSKKEALPDTMPKQERVAPLPTQERKAIDAVRDADEQRREQNKPRRQADAPVAGLGKAMEGVGSSADGKPAGASPPVSAPAPAPGQAPSAPTAAGAAAPTVSARALFYGEASVHPGSGAMAREKERAMQPLSESASQTDRPERRLDRFSQLGRAKSAMTQTGPLGLRYSFIVRGTEGQHLEADAATAAKNDGPIQLTIETNQDAYLQIWNQVGSATPYLLWPDKDTGQISIKIAAGQRQIISLPPASEVTTLTVRLSRAPFGPISRQEAAMLDRPASGQLQESVPREQATYVVNQDPSLNVQLTVRIRLKP